MVISVVDVDSWMVEVCAAIQASVVVGEELKNGGLWCSPSAKTSSPTSSAFSAMVWTALIRSASVGVRPVVGSCVMSLTVKIPNCMTSIP